MEPLHIVFGDSNNDISWWQMCARAVVVFAYGLALVRLSGPRIFGKWGALDLVVALVIGSNLSRTLTGNAPLIPTLAASTLLVVLHWLLSSIAVRSRWFSRVVEGKPVTLGQQGQVDEQALRRAGITLADLHEALRGCGLETPEGTRKIVLESSGNISVLKD
jgi:uncharacterized membrane protein YcaP (DUF421 family)